MKKKKGKIGHHNDCLDQHNGLKDKCSNRMYHILKHYCLCIYAYIVVLARTKIVQPSPAQQQPQHVAAQGLFLNHKR